MKIRNATIKLIILISVILLSSCTKPLSENILSRWQKYEQNGNTVNTSVWMEFFGDKTVTLSTTGTNNPKKTMKGIYTLSKDGRIKITINVLNIRDIEMIGQATIIDGNVLQLDLEGTGNTKWKKTK